MIRRAFLLVAAVAVALILTPNVAMAYNAVPYNCTVSDPSPTSGAAFTVNCVGVVANQETTLTPSSGGSAVTNNSNASGAVSFTVTLTTGTHTLTVTGPGNEVLGTLSVTVGGVGTAAGGVGGVLANTGSQPLGLAVGGGLLVLVGAGAVLVTRRRKLARVRA
jgi:LPXTG-motif cell wall-anchored protein